MFLGLSERVILHKMPCLECLILHVQLLEDAVHVGVAVKDQQDVADVHADCLVVERGVGGVAGEGLLVAVERESYQFASGVQDRGAGVASRYVAVVDEVHREGSAGGILDF